MRDDDAITCIILITAVYFLFLFAMVFFYKDLESNIASPKQFILNNATYRCFKTNELLAK